ncbi:hypothetical protein RB653_007807 [Dictyostelium firmibasis]|uniref:Rhodanese domain-containing protein n=1 Tax=Dictyostelium firmibasis TaxID=79012 RepID=A0AAN7U546_9MYCE
MYKFIRPLLKCYTPIRVGTINNKTNLIYSFKSFNNNYFNNNISLISNNNNNNNFKITMSNYTTKTPTIFNFKENKTINKQELKELIDGVQKGENEKNYVLIDVRNPTEVEQTSLIPTAIHIPLGILTAALSMSDSEYEDTFNQKKFDVSGKRSEMAADLARNMGYRTVLNYPGSFEDWISN